MPITHHDPTHHQLAWENDSRTQEVTIGPPDPEAAGWEDARDNEWACWLDISGTVLGLTAEHARRLAQLLRLNPPTSALIPAAPPHTDLAITVDTGRDRAILLIHRNNTYNGCRADIPAQDCAAIAHMLDQLSH
jgi:hypothetical protein